MWIDNLGPSYAELLLINDGSGSFTDETAARVSGNISADDNGVACVDLDHDGDLDVVIWSLGASERALQNDGSGHFTAFDDVFTAVDDPTLWGELGDLDGDGRLDAFTGQGEGNPETNLVYRGSATAPVDTRAPSFRAHDALGFVPTAGVSERLHVAVFDAEEGDEGPRVEVALRFELGGVVNESPAFHMGGDLFAVDFLAPRAGVDGSLSFCAVDRAGNEACSESISFTVQAAGGDEETGTAEEGDEESAGESSETGAEASAGESATGESGGESSDEPPAQADESGCGCRLDEPAAPLWLGVLGLFLRDWRRRRSTRG